MEYATASDKMVGTTGELAVQLGRFETAMDRLRSKTMHVRPREGSDTMPSSPEPAPRSGLHADVRQLSRIIDLLEQTIDELDL